MYYYRGVAYFAVKEVSKAEEDFKEAKQLDPFIEIKEVSKKEEKQDASIVEIGKDTKQAQKFQEVLEKDLKDVFSKKEGRWFGISMGWILLTVAVIVCLIASPWNSFSLTLVLIALIGLQWTLLFILCSMLIGIVVGCGV